MMLLIPRSFDRCHNEFLNRVDDWRERNAPELSRPQAIRQLAEIGLDHEEKRPRSQLVTLESGWVGQMSSPLF